MKLMISQPMAGKKYDEIQKEREAAVHALEAMGHTVVDTILTAEPPKDSHVALWYLSWALEKMSQCDGVLFLPGWESARGCRIEFMAAGSYGLKMFSTVQEVERAADENR